jgi:hypothetical protein
MLRLTTVKMGLALALAACTCAAARAQLPAKVDLAPEFHKFGLTPLQQGGRDVCSLFAVTAVAEFELAKNSEPPFLRLSEEYLIWAANEATGMTGDQAMFYEAVHGLNVLGICTDKLMPYENTTDAKRKPSPAARTDARALAGRWKVHWIKRWDVNRRLTAAELHAIKEALAAGHPVACGLRWPKTLPGHELIQVPPAGQVFDGHSIVFVGNQDDAKKPGGGVLFFRNSWGPQWGNQGYGVMSYAYATAYANDAVWLELGSPHAEVPLERFEAEHLPVLGKSNCDVSTQDMKDFGGPMWSQGKQLFCGAKNGSHIELGFKVAKAGNYRVRVLATAAPDFGTIRIALDGKTVKPDFDLYSGRVSPSGSLELGTHQLTVGQHRVRFTVVGKNAGSTNYLFGIDTLDLLPAP